MWTATNTANGQTFVRTNLGDLLFDVWRMWHHGMARARTIRRDVRVNGRYSDGLVVVRAAR